MIPALCDLIDHQKQLFRSIYTETRSQYFRETQKIQECKFPENKVTYNLESRKAWLAGVFDTSNIRKS
jgi:hypothetical protein